MCIFCGRWFCSSRWDGGCCAWAVALGSRAAYPSSLKVSCWVARKTHATFSSSLRCVSFVIEAVCSMACSVLVRFTMFWIFSRRIPGAVCFSLFHCKAMTLFAIHCWSVLIFLLPRFILLSCSCSTSLDSAFFAAESGSSYHWDAEITLERERQVCFHEVIVWIMKNCFFSAFPLPHKCFERSVFPLPLDGPLRQQALLVVAQSGCLLARRRAGRARRHRPTCCSELATRQVHEADARSAQLAAALGTRSSGPHHEPPRASAWCPIAAPGLVATRRSHRPATHTRGARPHQDSPCRHSRAAPQGACARSSVSAPGCTTGSTRTLPTAGSGARQQKHACAVTDLCDKNQVWTPTATAICDAEAAALHAHDELFSKHIEPEPAPEDPVEWAMADTSDDEDDAPMPDAPPEPELIDMPPGPASAPPMSNLERCIALRLVCGAGPR